MKGRERMRETSSILGEKRREELGGKRERETSTFIYKHLFFSWTNQIPSSSFSALSVQLWLTGPGWVAAQGAGIVSANSLASVAEFRGQTGEGPW